MTRTKKLAMNVPDNEMVMYKESDLCAHLIGA